MDFYIGQIILGVWRQAPSYLMLCNGATLQVSQYEALYSLIGNSFGGSGPQTFNLPNLVDPTSSSQGNNEYQPKYYMCVEGLYPNFDD